MSVGPSLSQVRFPQLDILFIWIKFVNSKRNESQLGPILPAGQFFGRFLGRILKDIVKRRKGENHASCSNIDSNSPLIPSFTR